MFFSGHQFTFVLVLLFPTGAKKTQVSQANKLKREERLTEIDDLMQNNKELQEQIMQKLDEARSLNATAEVRYFFYSLLLVRCGMYTSLTTGPPSQSLNWFPHHVVTKSFIPLLLPLCQSFLRFPPPSQAFHQTSPKTCWYQFLILGGEKHCGSKVFCPPLNLESSTLAIRLPCLLLVTLSCISLPLHQQPFME